MAHLVSIMFFAFVGAGAVAVIALTVADYAEDILLALRRQPRAVIASLPNPSPARQRPAARTRPSVSAAQPQRAAA